MKKEVKIGLTAAVALIALFVGIKFLKGVKLFSPNAVYYIEFANAKGLSKSSTVYADGFNVGIVSDIQHIAPGKVVVEIDVDRNMRIPKGSSAMLDEGMLGGCTLNMLMATNLTEAYQPGDTLKGSDSNGLMAAAANMLPQVEQAIARVDTLLETLNRLAADTNLVMILKNAEVLTNNLTRSTAELNKLLAQDVPQMTNTFTKAGENVVTLTAKLNDLDLQATMDSVNGTIASVHRMMEQIQNPQGTLGMMMKDPALYNNLNHTVQSADSLVTDLKSNPKRYVHFSVFGKKEK